jgi:hypothetical protein
MADYRIEFLTQGPQPAERLSLSVPDIVTALVVADINRPTGDVELWEGDHQIARLHREKRGSAGFWQIG